MNCLYRIWLKLNAPLFKHTFSLGRNGYRLRKRPKIAFHSKQTVCYNRYAMKIFIGADHAGYKLKEELEKYLKKQKHTVIDVGAHKLDKKDDYPTYAARVGRSVRKTKQSRGIVLCGNAEGVCITANKIRDVRAAVGYSEYAAKTSRTDDDANVLCLAGRVLKPAQAKKIVSVFIKTKFSQAGRHKRRLKKVAKIEKHG